MNGLAHLAILMDFFCYTRIMVNKIAFTALLLVFGLTVHVQAQLTVTASNNAANLVSTLVGPGVQVSNVTMNCPNGASGTFNGTNTNINIPGGVLLTSGNVAIAAQPDISDFEGFDNNAPGDNDLTILGGDPTFDACALEFDFVATCDTISIAYVFASEEYDEWVCSGVNDVFGFFLTGPGLNNVNIATVPGTTTPVSINTINNGMSGGFPPACISTNTAFYVSNTSNTHEYDGQTVRLLAKSWVQPCSTYHVKLVVADGGDGVYDSGVFLEQAGIRCASQQISINTATASGSNFLVEGCADATLYFERFGNLSVPNTIHYLISGTATNGTDYNFVADSIVFPIGIDSVGINISAPDDGLAEGIETIYIIVADSNCGGAYADTAELFILDPPVAAFASVSACPNFPVQFTNQSVYLGLITQYEWDFGDGSTSTATNPQHVYTQPGTYTVSLAIETTEGCRDSITQTVQVFSPPTANWSAAQFCHLIPTTFTDQSQPNISQWNWNFGNGNSSTSANPVYTYPNHGSFNASLIVTDGNGCRDTLTQPITIFPSPVAQFLAPDVCDDIAVQITDQSTMNPGSITTWNYLISDGTSSNQPTWSHLFAGPGSYLITLETISDQGCRDTISDSVTIHPNPVVDFTLSFACVGDTTQFTDQSSILSGSLVAWDWQFGDGGTSNIQNPQHVYLQSGNYTVTLGVTSDRGCLTVFSEQVGRPPMPESPNVIHDTVCTGYGAFVQAFSPEPGGIVRWYYTPIGVEPFFEGNSVNTPPITFTLPYFVEVLSLDGCVSERIPVFSVVMGAPNIPVYASAQEVEIPFAIVEFTTEDPGNQVQTYAWDFGDGITSNASDPVHQYVVEGVYNAVLTVTSSFGCVAVYQLPDINVTQNIRVHIPSAFTPNGDGKNDVFEINSRLITSLEVMIFDRWGKLLFSSNDIGFAWEGVDPAGQPLPEGVYTYLVKATAYDGSPVVKSGTITLLR